MAARLRSDYAVAPRSRCAGQRGETTMKIAAALIGLIAAVSLTACNTVQGVGKDVSSAGQAVTGTSKEVQKKIP
jgi:predicted small secreted protein